MHLVVKVGSAERGYELTAKIRVHDVDGSEIKLRERADKFKKDTRVDIDEKNGKTSGSTSRSNSSDRCLSAGFKAELKARNLAATPGGADQPRPKDQAALFRTGSTCAVQAFSRYGMVAEHSGREIRPSPMCAGSPGANPAGGCQIRRQLHKTKTEDVPTD